MSAPDILELDQLHADATAAVESFTLSRLDFDPPCQMQFRGQEPCGKPATWYAVCRQCGDLEPCCVQCREKILAFTVPGRWYMQGWLVFECDRCHHQGPWRACAYFVPLRGTR